jgi:hypothetical protein
LPEEDDRFVDMLGDLGRALERHATAMRNEMRVLFEDDDEDGGETRHG